MSFSRATCRIVCPRRAYFLFVNDERFDIHSLAHAIASKTTAPSLAEPR